MMNEPAEEERDNVEDDDELRLSHDLRQPLLRNQARERVVESFEVLFFLTCLARFLSLYPFDRSSRPT